MTNPKTTPKTISNTAANVTEKLSNKVSPKISRRSFSDSETSLDAALHPLLNRIYRSRGVQTPDELDRTLKTLTPYYSLKDIEPAAEKIAACITSQQKILIVGDFDCDGATSSALAVLALRELGAQDVHYLVPNRFEYGYGLSPEIVEVAKGLKPNLIITVDNGISSIEGVDTANAAGINVVITDHHLAGSSLPQADALVNPNQPDCEFPSKSLCGVGVIFYVMLAVRKTLEEQGWFDQQGIPKPNLANYLDLVALGTVADVVPLDHNNRILVEQGLRRIRAGKARPGILALLEVAGRDHHKVSAMDMGFIIGPRLNAAGRLDDMSIGIECLLTDLPDRAQAYALQLNELNQDRKSIERSMQDEAIKLLDSMSLAEDLPHAVCLYEQGWHEGVIGILASRIKDRLHRPVIAFAQSENGQIKGSARSIPGLHIRDALDAVASRHPHLLTKFGGHAMAAGLTLESEHFEAFSKAFAEEAQRQLSEDDLQQVLETDGGLQAQDINLSVAQLLRDGGPWGQCFPEPQFDGVFDIRSQRIVGERHLKMVLALPGQSEEYDGIAFNVDLAVWPSQQTQATVVYQLDINEFRGRTNVQLLIRHIEPFG